jgi:two-component system, chemotaxis family, chemotaxis protein CheY
MDTDNRYLENVSFLIVDPSAFMRSIIRSVLGFFGATKVIEAATGRDGIEYFQQYSPDMILTEMIMEGGDGLDLTRYVRGCEEIGNCFTPIIMVTSCAERDRIITARDCGVTEFVIKPLSAGTLAAHIAEVIERPRDFVRTEVYFGPDRRRRRKASFTGDDRRGTGVTDPAPPPVAAPAPAEGAVTQEQADTIIAGEAIESGD